jgi:two-component system, cell cycle response regulator DivK
MHKIAVIEDAEDNRDLLYYMLRDAFEVSRFSNGEEALAHFSQDQPDLIVLDIWLPGMDGVQVLQHVRRIPKLRGTPVIALTAHAMSGDREKYLAAGFDEYIAKPIVDIPEFVRTIFRVLSLTRDV